jgi:hypothetical protein
MQAQHVAEQLVASLLTSSLLLFAFGAAMFFTTTYSAVHCTLYQERDSKACWVMIIIFLPIFGFLAYWIFHDRSQTSTGEIPRMAIPRGSGRVLLYSKKPRKISEVNGS